jgi:cytochrome P450
MLRLGREAVLVGGRPLRSVRALANADFARAFPGNHRELRRSMTVAAAVTGVAAIGAVAVHPTVFLGTAAVFAGSAAVQGWRARPSFGRTRNWPPGSVVPGPEAMIDPDFYLRAWRRHGRVFKASLFGSPMVCVVGIEDGTALLRRHADDLAPVPLPFNRFVPGGMLRWMPEPQHAEMRRAFAVALSSRFVHSAQPAIARGIGAGLDAWADAARADPRASGPLPHVRALVLASWTEILLGLGGKHPAAAEAVSILERLGVYPAVPRPDHEVELLLTRLEHLIGSARPAGVVEDGHDLPANLAGELASVRADALVDPTVTRNLIFTCVTTHDDTAGLLVWIFKHLSDHPDWIERARTDTTGAVADAIVSETLRLEQSEFLFRAATRDIEFGGYVIPARWLVRLCIHESHRDPAHFAIPDDFDPQRFLSGRCGRDIYAPFGLDHRSCVGEVLTRTFARSFVNGLVHGFDWKIVVDGPRELSAHRHWAPSSRMQVQLTAR